MIKDPKPYLDDILESIEKIEEYTKNIKEKKFYQSSQIQDAILRRLEIIGEAVKNLPKNFRDKYHQMPWKKLLV